MTTSRIEFSRSNGAEQEIDRTLEVLPQVINRLRAVLPVGT